MIQHSQSKTFPINLYGGAGSRLWPSSIQKMPKQFIDLMSSTSLFKQAAQRVVSLNKCARLIVVTGQRYAKIISAQLSQLGIEAELLLEPEGRDSAAAIYYIRKQHQNGIAVFVASDHYIPELEHFQADIAVAAEASLTGGIVTLGIMPTEPSSAYGYIHPLDCEDQVAPVVEFVEKPDVNTAEQYLEDGYLRNSGNFIASVDTVFSEFRQHANDALDSVEQSFNEGIKTRHGFLLGPSFSDVRRVLIDFAIIEATNSARVLKSELKWSDLGAHDSVHAILPQDENGNAVYGNGICLNTRGSLIRAKGNANVVVSEMDGVMVVVEGDVIFVSQLDQSQNVKLAVEHFRNEDLLPHSCHKNADYNLPVDAAHRIDWLKTTAFSLWSSLGCNHKSGIWNECLDGDYLSSELPCRARVQGRQAYVYAMAGKIGWTGPWMDLVVSAFNEIKEHCVEPTGLLKTLVSEDGDTVDETVFLYDQTFVLLELAVVNQFSEVPLDGQRSRWPTSPSSGPMEVQAQKSILHLQQLMS